jgi:hypothetical protein
MGRALIAGGFDRKGERDDAARKDEEQEGEDGYVGHGARVPMTMILMMDRRRG